MEDYKQLREVLTDVLTLHDEVNVERFKNVNERLTKIDNHLEKLNGKVVEHEKTLVGIAKTEALHKVEDDNYVMSRHLTCPQKDRIDSLEKDKSVRIGMKQLIISGLSILAVMISIAVGTIKITESYNQKTSKEQTKEIVKEILIELKNEDFYY